MSEDTRSRRAMLIAGLLLIALGTVSVAVNLPYLPDGDGWDAGVPWVSAGCGTLGVAGGIWWLVVSRRTGAPHEGDLMLRKGGGSYKFNAIMLGVCVVLLVAGLMIGKPTVSTGLPSLLAFNFVRGLFVPRGEATSSPAQGAGQSGNSGG